MTVTPNDNALEKKRTLYLDVHVQMVEYIIHVVLHNIYQINGIAYVSDCRRIEEQKTNSKAVPTMEAEAEQERLRRHRLPRPCHPALRSIYWKKRWNHGLHTRPSYYQRKEATGSMEMTNTIPVTIPYRAPIPFIVLNSRPTIRPNVTANSSWARYVLVVEFDSVSRAPLRYNDATIIYNVHVSLR